jgi:hypothetical protein
MAGLRANDGKNHSEAVARFARSKPRIPESTHQLRFPLVSTLQTRTSDALESAHMVPRADELDEIHWRLRVSNLEARVELREIEAAALTREITSPLTSVARQNEAFQRRQALLTEASELKAELDQLRKSIPSWTRH